jgi:hypothetical protein
VNIKGTVVGEVGEGGRWGRREMGNEKVMGDEYD